jgi:bis(5'-nucleosyl)-tetraphosphatase (symmetrical)
MGYHKPMTLYAIGDIQGCATAFDELLNRIAFDPSKDRLWLVGDLVNRGPDSLGVLRRVSSLGENATSVLGNHDLHLLAAAAGIRALGPKDTLGPVLDASDAVELIDWLRERPLVHYDAETRRALVHAGLPPGWTLEDTLQRAGDLGSLLRGPRWREALGSMYGSEPRAWSSELNAEDQRRFLINALTRMRYCDRQGRLDFEFSGPPGSQPAELLPWFDVPCRLDRDTHIVFGHWAALGVLRRADVTALDSGCVWGGALTALPLDPPGEPVTVSCARSPAGHIPSSSQ